jgi:hypothetical protein
MTRCTTRLWVLFVIASMIIVPEIGLAIRPGDVQDQPQQSAQATTGETGPTSPPRQERPVPSSQESSRAIVEYPQAGMQTQPRYADTFLPNSVWHVSDPQDGLTKDGRVAVLEGSNAQVVYQFYQQNNIVNIPGQPDLTIYTHDKGGFDGPYNVFVANFGESAWTQVGMDVTGTSAFDLPPALQTAELVLITNQHDGATYIEAVQGITRAATGATQGMFGYIPEDLTGLRAQRIDCAEVERARILLTNQRQGYQLAPLGEIELRWHQPIQNAWKQEEFLIQAEGEYEVYASDSRGMETLIGRRSGTQSIDLPQDMIDAATVRIRNHSGNRPVMIYAIVGRQ